MPENNVRKLRERAGITQRDLASKVGTSQQQIQRIEAGIQAVRLDVAVQLSAAFGVRLAELFPKAAMPLARAKKRPSTDPHELIRLYKDEKAATELEAAGLDMELENWFFQFVLRNGLKATLPISGPDYHHLWRRVQSRDRRNFLVFDSGPHRYAINGDHLLFCHFLFEPPDRQEEEEVSEHIEAKVYLSTGAEPLNFDLDLAEGDENNDLDDPSEWQNVFAHLDGLSGSLEDAEVDRISFVDVDGERAFFRTDDVAMLQVSLTAVEERMADSMEECEHSADDGDPS
jgi:transcriptional regulator with XRE-family HTH domain